MHTRDAATAARTRRTRTDRDVMCVHSHQPSMCSCWLGCSGASHARAHSVMSVTVLVIIHRNVDTPIHSRSSYDHAACSMQSHTLRSHCGIDLVCLRSRVLLRSPLARRAPRRCTLVQRASCCHSTHHCCHQCACWCVCVCRLAHCCRTHTPRGHASTPHGDHRAHTHALTVCDGV